MPKESKLNLQLIDCDNSEIVPAPKNAQYVALIYVWGAPVELHGLIGSEATSENSRRLPSTVPLVITDSDLAKVDSRTLVLEARWGEDKLCVAASGNSASSNLRSMHKTNRHNCDPR